MALSGGFIFLILSAALLIVGNGQFAVSSPFYGESPMIRTNDQVSPSFQVTPLTKQISDEEDSISPNASFDPLASDGGSQKAMKQLMLPNKSKQSQERIDEPKQVNKENNSFNNPDGRTFSGDGISPMDQFWTEMILVELTSRLSELLNYLETITTRPPLSKYLLNGIDYLNPKEDDKHPTGKLLSVIKEMVLKGRQRFNQWVTTESNPDSNGYGYTQYHIHLRGSPPDDIPELTTNEPHDDAERYFEYSDGQVSRTGNPWSYFAHNVKPNTEKGRSNYRSKNNNRLQGSGRSRLDNNLRQVQEVPYEGFYPEYSKEDPYMGALHSGYYSEYPDNDYESGYHKHQKKSRKPKKKQDKKRGKPSKDRFYDEDFEKSSIDRHDMKREKDKEEKKESNYSLGNNLNPIREMTYNGFNPEYSKDYPYIGALHSGGYSDYPVKEYESYFKDYPKHHKKSKKPKQYNNRKGQNYRFYEEDAGKSRSDKYDTKREKGLRENNSMYSMYDMNPDEEDLN